MNLVERIIYNNKNNLLNWCLNNISTRYNEHQLKVLKDESNKKLYNIPKRSGRSFVICSEALYYAFNYSKQDIIIFTSSNLELDKIKVLLLNILDHSKLNKRIKCFLNNRLLLDNGSIIKIIAINNINSIRGQRANSILIDDYDHCSSESISYALTCAKYDSNHLLVLS